MRTKSHILAHTAILALAASMISCVEAIDRPANDRPVDDEKLLQIEFNCSSAETKTAYNGKEIWWNAGDSLRFFQLYYKTADATSQSIGYVQRKVSEATATYSTTINYTTPAKYPADYLAVYPDKAYKSLHTASGSTSIDLVRLSLSANQVPTTTSFDPHADLLLSEHIVSEDAKVTSFNLRFKRLVALGKMNLTNIPSESNVRTVKFSATKGGQDVHLTGDKLFRLNDGTVFSEKTYSTTIAMNYSGLNQSSSMTANFCCYPFELAEGDSFTVTVFTDDDRYYIKEVTIPEGRDLIFERGHGTDFTVNMNTSFLRATIEPSTTSFKVNYYGNMVSKVTISILKASAIASISEDEYETKVFSKPSTYGSTLYSAMTATNLAKINDEGAIALRYSVIASNTPIEADTEYVVMIKGTSTTGATKFMYFKTKTDAAADATE